MLGRGVEKAAGCDRGAGGSWEVRVGGADADAVRDGLVDERAAPDGSGDSGDAAGGGDRADAADHRDRAVGECGGAAGRERSARLNFEAVGAECVELGEQVGFARCRDAHDGDERGDTDGDPDCRERGAEPARADADAADAEYVDETEMTRARSCGLRRSVMAHVERAEGVVVDRGHAVAVGGIEDLAVAHDHAAGNTRGDRLVVRDEHDRGAVAVQLFKRVDDRFAGAGVEIAGWFVGEQQRGFGDDRAGDRDALALTA